MVRTWPYLEGRANRIFLSVRCGCHEEKGRFGDDCEVLKAKCEKRCRKTLGESGFESKSVQFWIHELEAY